MKSTTTIFAALAVVILLTSGIFAQSSLTGIVEKKTSTLTEMRDSLTDIKKNAVETKEDSVDQKEKLTDLSPPSGSHSGNSEDEEDDNSGTSEANSEASLCALADINKNGYVTGGDVLLIKPYLYKTGCSEANARCNGRDITRDGKVDEHDMEIAQQMIGCATNRQGKSLTDSIPPQTETKSVVFAEQSLNSGDETNEDISYPEETPSSAGVNIELSPEKQESEDGTAMYKVVIKNTHSPSKTVTIRSEEYRLEFLTKQDIKGSFSEEKVKLSAGESAMVILKVEAEEEGSYVFSVSARNTGNERTYDATHGLLIVGENHFPDTKTSFQGFGFALSTDKTHGKAVEISFIQEGETIKGKMDFGGEVFKIQGKNSDNDVSFHIYEVRSSDSSDVVGEFNGEMKEFPSLALLTGDVEFENAVLPETWALTAVSKKVMTFDKTVVIESDAAVVTETAMEEVLTIKESSSSGNTNEVYVRPVEVEKSKKILGFFPNPFSKPQLNVEIIDGDKVTRKALYPFTKTKVNGYEIEVKSSLESENDIKLEVTKSD